MAKVILYENCGCFTPTFETLNPDVDQWRKDMNDCGKYPTKCEVSAMNKLINATVYAGGGWQEETILIESDVPEIDTGLAKTEDYEYEIKKVIFVDNAAYQRDIPGAEIVFNSDTGMIETPGYAGSTVNIEYRKKQLQ